MPILLRSRFHLKSKMHFQLLKRINKRIYSLQSSRNIPILKTFSLQGHKHSNHYHKAWNCWGFKRFWHCFLYDKHIFSFHRYFSNYPQIQIWHSWIPFILISGEGPSSFVNIDMCHLRFFHLQFSTTFAKPVWDVPLWCDYCLWRQLFPSCLVYLFKCR